MAWELVVYHTMLRVPYRSIAEYTLMDAHASALAYWTWDSVRDALSQLDICCPLVSLRPRKMAVSPFNVFIGVSSWYANSTVSKKFLVLMWWCSSSCTASAHDACPTCIRVCGCVIYDMGKSVSIRLTNPLASFPGHVSRERGYSSTSKLLHTFRISLDSKILHSIGNFPLLEFKVLSRHITLSFDDAS